MGRKPPSDNLLYWLALLRAPGIGANHYQRILQHHPDPATLFEDRDLADELQLPVKTTKYLKKPAWKQAEADLRWAEGEHCHIISWQDLRYPPLLKQTAGSPPLLFVRGNPEAICSPQLAIVGSRNPSPGGRQTAISFAQKLASTGLTITSGLALGIDAASHQGAMQANGATIAVAGTGPDRIYPARHRDLAREIVEFGAIVSEFPPGTPPIASNFPRRNRIISGLSLGTLVVEAALKSGSLITARLAADQGREVFAIPGSIHNPLARGCHALIRQGAKLTEDIGDVLEEIGPLAKVTLLASSDSSSTTNAIQHPDDPVTENLINNMGFEATSIDTLVMRSGLTPEVVSSMLVSLELQGRVTSTGGLYCRTD